METTIILKFLHVKAQVKVWKVGIVFHARITFPYTYIEAVFNNKVIDGISATTIQNACEMAAMMFKERYGFLDKPLRQLHRFNFYVHRAVFQRYVFKTFEDERFGFRLHSHVWAISEKVDGKLWFKSKFQHREELTTLEALITINYQLVLKHMADAGFNYKLIKRVIDKYDTTPLSDLRLFDDKKIVYLLPENVKLVDHVKLPAKEQSLGELLFLHKVTKDLKKPFIP